MSIKRTIITTIVALALVAVVAPAAASALTAGCTLSNTATCSLSDLLTLVGQLNSQLTGLSAGTGAPAASAGTGNCSGIVFSRYLRVGSVGQDVKCLQTILNQNESTKVSVTQAGAPGYETTYFGQKTLLSVHKYQQMNGLIPASQVGPQTIKLLNAAIGSMGGTTYVPPNPAAGCPAVVTGTVYNSVTGQLCPITQVNQTGAVSATLASDNPPSGAVIGNQAQADLLHVNFTGSGTVTSVTLQKSGISTQSALSAVYLYDGNVRLTDGYSFNSNGTLTINGLSILVSGSHTVSVKADTGVYSGNDSSIAVALTGFVANGSTASANVVGNMMAIVPGAGATAYMTSNTATSTADVDAGTTQYTMWSDSIQIGTRSVQLKGMNFKMIGSAPTNALANIELFIDGVDTGKVATVVPVQGSNYAMFDLTSSPIPIATGTHTIDVRADIVSGAYRTMQLSVQQAADMTIYDAQMGINIAVTATSSTAFVADTGTTVSIKTGSSSVVVDPTFNSQTDVTAGATNVVIGKYLIHGYGEDVKVASLSVLPLIKSAVATNCSTDASGTTVTSACGLTNVTLYFNGSQVGAQTTWTHDQMAAATAIPFTLGSQMIIPAGQDSTLEVRADLQTAAGANYTGGTIQVTLVGATTNATGQSSSNSLGFPQTSNVSTSGLTISSASLTVAKNTGYADTTVVPNQPNVKIGSFVLQNRSTSESVRLTTLTIGLYQSGGSSVLNSTMLTGLSSLKTSEATNPIQPSSSNVFSVNSTLAPGQQKTIDIFANVGSSSLITAVVTKLTVASIGVTSNIVSTGSVTTGQTISFGIGTIGTPTKASNTTTAQYVVGGAGSVSKASFNFKSSTSASTITELKFDVSGSDATPTGTVTQICVGSVCGGPVYSSGTSVIDLTGLSIAVPNGGNGVNVDALVSYANVGTGGVIPNNTSTVGLSYVKYSTGGTAKALGSSAECTAYPAPTCTGISVVTANAITLVGSLPVITIPSGGGSGLVINQSTKVGDVIIGATGGDIQIGTLVFNVTFAGYSTLPTSTSAASLKYADGTAVSGYSCDTGSITSGAITVTCTADTATYAGHTLQISKDSSQELNLYVTTAGASNSGASVPTASSSLARSTFAWDDTSYGGSGNVGLNLSGTLISAFPTNGSFSIHQ